MKRRIITIESSISLAINIRNNVYSLINQTEEKLEECFVELEEVSKQCITSKESIQYRKLHIMVTGSETLINEVHELVFNTIIKKCDYPAKITEKTEDVYKETEDITTLFCGIMKDFLG